MTESQTTEHEPVYAAREIQHVIPVDGFDHDLEDCICHPEIKEESAFAASIGLDEELGVKRRGSGALIFSHNKLAEAHVYQFVDEVAEWEDERPDHYEHPDPGRWEAPERPD